MYCPCYKSCSYSYWNLLSVSCLRSVLFVGQICSWLVSCVRFIFILCVFSQICTQSPISIESMDIVCILCIMQNIVKLGQLLYHSHIHVVLNIQSQLDQFSLGGHSGILEKGEGLAQGIVLGYYYYCISLRVRRSGVRWGQGQSSGSVFHHINYAIAHDFIVDALINIYCLK